MNVIEQALQFALRQGADRDVPFSRDDVVYSREFRDICRGNACGKYGACYRCPPDEGDIDALMAAARAHPAGVIYQTIVSIEESFDIEGMLEGGLAHAGCSQRIRRALAEAELPPALHLSVGGCRLCPRCAREDHQPCRFPGASLSSLEAYGIDVYRTAHNVGLHYQNGPNTVTYFGILFFDDAPDTPVDRP